MIGIRGASFITHNKLLSTILEFVLLENGELVARGTNQVIRGLEPSAPSLTSGGREEDLDIEFNYQSSIMPT